MLSSKILPTLQNKKNLLAFSAGGDSTALFFLLLDANVDFDIAIVDYGLREQSKDEVLYAKELASKYAKECYIFSAKTIEKNFEARAREIRYTFFEELIQKYNYDNLLTAHHLGDRFEWMLMQFCRGSGCVEIAGMQVIEHRDNYKLVRPLLGMDKSELLDYLNDKNIKYFEDKTNLDESIKRNSFRHSYSNPLLKNYKDGIKKSFAYIDEDRKDLVQEVDLKVMDDFAYFPKSNSIRTNIYTIDKYLKSCGHLVSASEKELLKTKQTIIIGRKFLINNYKGFIFISPYIKNNIIMEKEFKEKMRIYKIEPKLRAYIYKNQNIYEFITKINNLY